MGAAAPDLATLAVTITNTQAVAAAKQTTAALNEMGAAGERANLKLVNTSNPVTEAIKRQAVSQRFLAQAQTEAIAVNDRLGNNHQKIAAYMTQASAAQRAMTLKQIEAIAINEKLGAATEKVTAKTGFFAAIQDEAAGGVGKHSLAIGRLERVLAGFVGRAVGVGPVIETLVASVGKFAVGTLPMVAGLLAIGAAVWVYDKLTEGARKAAEANDKLRQSIDAVIAKKGQGPLGETHDQIRDLLTAIQADRDKLNEVRANSAGNPDIQAGRVAAAELQLSQDRARLRVLAKERGLIQLGVTQKAEEPSETAAGQAKVAAAYHNRSLVAGELADREARLQEEIRNGVVGLDASGAAFTRSQLTIKAHAQWLVEDAKKFREVTDATEASVRTANRNRDSLLLVGRALEVSNVQWEYQNELIRISKTLHGEAAKVAVAGAEKVRDAQMDAVARGWKTAPVKAALTGAEDTFGQFFGDLVTKGTAAWTNLMGNIRNLYASTVSELAKMAFETKILPKIAGLFGLQADPGAVLMASAATTQVTAGTIMQAAAAEMIVAANVMAGTAGVPGAHTLPPVTATASQGPSNLQLGGAAIGGALAGYSIGGALYNQNHSGAQNYAVGALGGAAGGAATGFAIAGPVGAAVGALAGLAGGLLGAGAAAKKAAAELHKLQDELKDSFTALRAKVAGDTLGQALAQNDSELKKFLLQINAALPGKANESERNNERAQAADLYGQLADQLKKADAAAKEAAKGDLQVRLLAAQGRDKEAAALRLQLAQQKEMQDAVAAHTDPATLALLQQVQAQEKLKAATDSASTSALNMVEGYKLQALFFRASSPHLPGTSTGVLTSPPVVLPPAISGSGSRSGGDLTVPLIVDGKVLAQVVLKNFKGSAQRTTGDSTQWPTIQSV